MWPGSGRATSRFGATVPAVIDTHVHVVSADRDRYPLRRHEHPGHEWVDLAPDAEAFGAAMWVADIDGAVLVQPHGAYRDDNTYTCDAAAADDRLAAVAIVDVTAPDRAARVTRLVEHGVAGLRLFSIPTPAVGWLDDPATDDVWAVAAEAGLTMGVCVLPVEVEAVAAVAARHAGAPVVLDHCGFVDPAGPELAPLAELPNVTLKVTTHVIDAWVDGGRPLDELFPTLAGRVGAGRLLWGSDYAQTHDRTYADLVALGRQALAALGAPEQDAVGHANAATLWF